MVFRISDKGLEKYVGREVSVHRHYASEHFIYTLYHGKLSKDKRGFQLEVDRIVKFNYKNMLEKPMDEITKINENPKLKQITLSPMVKGETNLKNVGDSIEIDYPFVDKRSGSKYIKAINFEYIGSKD